MKVIIVSEKEKIRKLVENENIGRMIVHIDDKNKKVFYESDYTRYELRESVDYDKAISVLEA